jgi:dimeric dUTPase (all-alpha-NTP-PPase superfamily)
MNRFITALDQESAELRDSVPWKWWKHQQGDLQNARVEIIDMMHFLISLAQTAGMTSDMLYQGYLQKNKINHNRQDGGYALPGFDALVDDNLTVSCQKA